MNSKINLFWFRRDLRLNDNTALYHALKSGNKVQCVFIFDTNILDKIENKSDARLEFIYQQLQSINRELHQYGSSIIVEISDPVSAWKKWMKQFDVSGIYLNDDYEPYARERDEQIEKLALKNNITFNKFKDHVIFEKSEVVKNDGSPYTVFTPYKNKYLQQLSEKEYKFFDTKKLYKNFNQIKLFELPPLESTGFNNVHCEFPDSKVTDKLIVEYGKYRDFPDLNATSKLSVHLRFGTISVRRLVDKCIQLGADVYLNELIWRDFYQMILWNFPQVAHHSFKPVYDRIPWRNNEFEFQKWCEGKTGYPIVDAGMRQLNKTGFMHNRVRMITASFLVKHLLVDWRWGENYFAQKLLDFDLAANNGGWQWAASSGCDAAPYFRIFNPHEQTKRFDPEMKYIRKWVPDFEELSYPTPIVDHKFARERCLAVYKKSVGNKGED